MHTSGPVVVMELPHQLNLTQAKTFLRELQPLLEADRPRLVLECSQIHDMDSAGVEMLLGCMQEAMKRDGDLKLAAVSPASGAFLELMRVDRLFEIFDTAKEAVQSFDEFRSYALPESELCHAPSTALELLKATS
jgi:anti-sigma B factor antagonist